MEIILGGAFVIGLLLLIAAGVMIFGPKGTTSDQTVIKNNVPVDDMTDSQKITMLISRITLLQAEIDKKNLIIEAQTRKINFYIDQLKTVENRLKDLESMIYRTGGKEADGSYLQQELLLIAVDPIIQRQDEIALNKSKMDFHRVINATQDKIEQQLRRARQNRAMYKYIMFSGHADRNGLKMSDSTYLDSYWLNQNMSGVEILYLNGCETTSMADDLVGIVSCVISMDEKIPTRVAQSFAEIFWTGIASNKSPQEAFDDAANVEPTAKAYATIRY